MKTNMHRIILIILCCVPLVFLHAQNTDKLNRPIVVIDGVIQENFQSDWPKDEAASTILQPEEAVKQYGERGKNGAIVILTRDYIMQSGDSALIKAITTDKEKNKIKTKQENMQIAKKVLLTLFLISIIGFCWVILWPVLFLIYDRRRGEQVSPAPLYVRIGEFLWDNIAVQILQAWIPIFAFIESIANGDLAEPSSKYFSLFLVLFCGIMSFAVFFFYYYICEYKWGKTLGKKFFRTMVVNDDGTKPTRNAIAIRTLCRLIPFDSISFLFTNVDENGNMTRTWHDTLSHTRVVRDNRSTTIKKGV